MLNKITSKQPASPYMTQQALTDSEQCWTVGALLILDQQLCMGLSNVCIEGQQGHMTFPTVLALLPIKHHKKN